MSNKKINQLFEALTPNSEQKEMMFQHILRHSRNETVSNFTPVKRLRLVVLTAVLMFCLTTTALAAAYMGLDESFLSFLKPVNNEQAVDLSNGVYAADKQVVNKNGILDIKQVIGDSNLTYILMDFTAPEGTVLNAARYRFEYAYIDSDQSYHSSGFKVLDDGNPHDNKISLIMTIMTKNSIAGQNVHVQLTDVQAADQFPGVFETVIPGTWETSIKLDFKEYSSLYKFNQEIDMFGYSAIVKSVSVSPIAVSLKIESESMKEINEAAGNWKETGENIFLDNYPITINYKDGTSETTNVFNGLYLGEPDIGQMLTIKTFDRVINDKEIASIIFFNNEFPINN